MKQSLFFFASLTDTDVEWIGSVAERDVFKPGERLIVEGEASHRLFVILTGAIAISINRKQVATVTSGDILGEISLFDTRPPSATATATEDTVALSVPFAQLKARLDADPEFASRLYFGLGVLLSQRMRSMLGSMIEDPDELDHNAIDRAAIAGLRFEMLKERREAS